MARISRKEKAAIFNTHELMTREIMGGRDAQFATDEGLIPETSRFLFKCRNMSTF